MICEDDVIINIDLTDGNKLNIECANVNDEYSYAFYIYKDNRCIEKIMYKKENHFTYWLTELGVYKVKVFIKNSLGEKITKESGTVLFDYNYLKPLNDDETKKKKGFFYNVKYISKELIENFVRMYRLAFFDYKIQYKDSYLGMIWSILNPLLQIGTYWLVFGMGLRRGNPVGGHPYLPWMLTGLVPWFFINKAVLSGSSSIHSKSGTVTKMKYPISTVPFGSVFVAFFEHIPMMLIMFIIIAGFGYVPNLRWLNLIYYMVYAVCFTCALSTITSVLTMVARDFNKLLQSIIRMLFYLTPILWTMGNMPEIYQSFMKLNPFFYIVDGYRTAILDGMMFFYFPRQILFFWSIVAIMYIIGCNLQMKFKNKFIDLI